MTSVRPNIQKDGHYNVTETCKHLGINKDTLRKYTSMGWIKHHIQMGTCRKFYLGADILQFFDAAY